MRTLSEYVSWLNSMTTPELLKEFPGQFHTLNANEGSSECVKKMLANDAILWRMVKEYNQKLLSTPPSTQNNELVTPAVSNSVCKHYENCDNGKVSECQFRDCFEAH